MNIRGVYCPSITMSQLNANTKCSQINQPTSTIAAVKQDSQSFQQSTTPKQPSSPIITPPTDPVSSAPDTPKTTAIHKLGCGYIDREGEGIPRASINAFQNSINRAEMKEDQFYSSVMNLYNKTFKPAHKTNRNLKSIKKRTKSIFKDFWAFANCVARTSASIQMEEIVTIILTSPMCFQLLSHHLRQWWNS